jgi:hypothetical protein
MSGDKLERLSFTDRQTVAQCLIKKVVVTGEQAEISYVLPFDSAPQVYNSSGQQPEGTPGHFHRWRLADLHGPPVTILGEDGFQTQRQVGGEERFQRRGRLALPGLTGVSPGGAADHHDAQQVDGQHRRPPPVPGVDCGPGFAGVGLPAAPFAG